MGVDQLGVHVCRSGGIPGTDVDIEPEQRVARVDTKVPGMMGDGGDWSMEEESGIVGKKGLRILGNLVKLL